jgi:hypothetical protein
MSAAAPPETASAAALLEVRDAEKAFLGVRGPSSSAWPATKPKNPAMPANEHADGSGMNEGSRRKTC